MADNRTMEELLQAPTKWYGEAIVSLKINADHFEIKTNLLQLVQANPYHGFERENPHTHINNFKRITSTLKFRDVPNDVIKLMMFSYSLEGTARVWENTSKTDDRIDKLADQISTLVDIFAKKVVTPALVKSVEESYVTCGGPHAHYNCDATNSNQPSVCVATGTYNQVAPQNRASNYMIEETTDKEQTNFQGSTAHIQPPITPILEPDVPNTLPKPNIPYPLRLNDQKHREKAMNQMDMFFQIFQDLHFDISFADALLLMPKFASTIKSLLKNKGKLFELAKISLNENCSEMLLKKLPENLRDPDKILIPCGNPTSTSEPILSDSSLSLTPFEGSDFILEEIDAYLKDGASVLELKDLPSHLEYAYLEGVDKLPVIIAKYLKDNEKQALLKVLKSHKRAIAWKITDIKGIDPRFCTHKILMEEDYKPAVQSQRRVNPKIHKVIKKEVIKLLDAEMIYLISGSPYVSPIHCVPKKGGMIVVENENNELIPTRCMMAIFHDMIEKTMEVFMDDFSVFGDSFSSCLSHLAFKYLLSKQDDKPRLIRWVLLLQEFDIILRNKKGTENLAADHLSRLENPHTDVFENKDINENFPLKTLGKISSGSIPWYILVAVDYLSKWVEAKALPTNDARVVVKFLKSLFARFKTPRAIISDRGTHFCNDKFAKVMSKYGVTHRLATAYHPQTSRQVEVSNRGLKRILERTVGENRASWSEKLENALWAFRTAYKTPIMCTPYKLVYGKSCHLPIELEHKAYWTLKHVNFDLKTTGDHQKLQLTELNKLRDQAYKNSLIYKEKTKKLHDYKIKNHIFNVGDRVLLFNSYLKIFSRRLKTHWSGPFTITKDFLYGTVELSQPDGLNFKVNGHRVKHYFGGDVP
nr:reverse transcriptase domain-containing protein [Tanacetum cinerariifolium]